MDIFAGTKVAQKRLSNHIIRTSLFHSTYLSKLNEGEVYLKLESEQYTGSFKARGALNKVLGLCLEEKNQGLITASTGNHAQGFARALWISGATGTIVLPKNAEPSKIDAIKQYNVALEFYGNNPLEAEMYAKQKAADQGLIWVSPYNDVDVIAGQGTLAAEITAELKDISALFGCIGGGGMMSGVATWFKRESPDTTIVGCLPQNSPEMYLSVKENKVVFLENYIDTLSDGSAGGLEEGSITFDICKELIDRWELVTEAEIAETIRYMVEKHHKIVEGSAAVAIRSFMNSASQYKNQRVVIVVCGANIRLEKLKALL